MKAEETIDFYIKWAWHKINRWYNVRAAEFGGTMAIGYVLLSIDKKEGTPSTSLGPSMGMESTSLVRLLKGMEEKGLICRKVDKEDKRKVIIFLTALGIEKRAIAKQTVIALNEELRTVLTESELRTFFKTMGKLNNHLNQLQITK